MPNQNQDPSSHRTGSRRGFAAMDEQKQREIASLGGRAAHRSGNAHEFTAEEARAAGRKGGEAVSRNREHMAAIGARGGEASGGGRNAARSRSGSGDRDAPATDTRAFDKRAAGGPGGRGAGSADRP